MGGLLPTGSQAHNTGEGGLILPCGFLDQSQDASPAAVVTAPMTDGEGVLSTSDGSPVQTEQARSGDFLPRSLLVTPSVPFAAAPMCPSLAFLYLPLLCASLGSVNSCAVAE